MVGIVAGVGLRAGVRSIFRLNALRWDLNRRFGEYADDTLEVQAVMAAIEQFDVRALVDCHEGGRWEPCELAYDKSDAVPAAVRSQSQGLYDAVTAELISRSIPVDYYVGLEDYDPALIGEMSWGAIPRSHGIPSLLVETPTSGIPVSWEGPDAHPKIYEKPFETRMGMYYGVFDAAAEHVASMATV